MSAVKEIAIFQDLYYIKNYVYIGTYLRYSLTNILNFSLKHLPVYFIHNWKTIGQVGSEIQFSCKILKHCHSIFGNTVNKKKDNSTGGQETQT